MNRHLLVVLLLVLTIPLAMLIVRSDDNPHPCSDIGTALYCERDPSGNVHCWER